MAHFVDENDPNYNFKGWRFYFNSYTLRGRFNVGYLCLLPYIEQQSCVFITIHVCSCVCLRKPDMGQILGVY